jgi:Caspase domain
MKMPIRICLMWLTIVLLCQVTYGQCSKDEVAHLKRTALIIGVNTYQNLDILNNPVNDAFDVRTCLTKLHFDVRTVTNVTRHQLDTAISGWLSTLSRYDIALFYFAGHGSEIDGVNYIYPVDGNADSRALILRTAYSVNALLDSMQAKNQSVNIVLMDACRDNPLGRGPSKFLMRKGFSSVSSFHNPGVIIGFSTSPGKRTSDGDSRNGFYTSALLENLLLPNLKLTDIFAKVNDATQVLSDHSQLPYISSSLGDHNNYCLLIDDRSLESKRRLTDTFYAEKLGEFKKKATPPGAAWRHLANEALQTGLSKTVREINNIADSIKSDFQPYSISQNPPKIGDTAIATIMFGIKSAVSDSQYIIPLFTMKAIGNLFIFTISSEAPNNYGFVSPNHDHQIYQYETDHLLDHSITDIQPLTNVDWNEITEFIKGYFYSRLGFLAK